MEDDFDTFMTALKAEEDEVRRELSSDRMGFFPVYAMREYDFFLKSSKKKRLMVAARKWGKHAICSGWVCHEAWH